MEETIESSGMHWTVRGANSIIALRCCIDWITLGIQSKLTAWGTERIFTIF